MGILSKCEPSGPSIAAPKWPRLMVCESGSVVLFSSSTSGTCVHAAPGSLMSVGDYSANRNSPIFWDFKGVITLEAV